MTVGATATEVLSGVASWAVLTGDCITLDLPDESIDAVVTDPPAGIGFMGKGWDHDKGGRAAWVAWMTERMRVAFRLLKPGGHAIVWALPRTSHWTATAVEDAGFEVRDVLTHHFGSGFPKSLDVSKAIDSAAGAVREVVGSTQMAQGGELSAISKSLRCADCGKPRMSADPCRCPRDSGPATPEAAQWQGWGTALKPAVERWVLARKPIALLGEVVSLAQCLSLSLVRIAADLSRSSHVAAEPDSALPSAAPPSATPGASSEVTATSSCATASDTPLSTVSSWLAILADVSALASTFTTETASRTTTDLRTLSCLASKITQESTPPDALSQSGWTAFAESAAPSFDSLRASCDETQACTAGGSAGESLSPRWGSASQAEENEEPTGPGSEDWILARKPLIGTVAQNVLAHGTGALNVDACRVAGGKRSPGFTDGAGVVVARVAGGAMPNRNPVDALGRWPTNLLLSHGEGCREVGATLAVRNVETGGRGSAASKSAYGDGVNGRSTTGVVETVTAWDCAPDCPVAELDRQSGERPSTPFRENVASGSVLLLSKRTAGGYADSGGASRFYPTFRYVPKAPRAMREEGLRAAEGERGNDHPTVKHDDLMRWLCRLVTPPCGVVLDLFCGSGSTGRGALKEGFRFIGIDAEAHYVEIAEQRIAAVAPVPVEPEKQTTIFDLLARSA